MSRKPRRHKTPERVPDPPAFDEFVDYRSSVHRLSGEQHQLVEALISAHVYLARGPVPPGLLDPESDEFQAFAAEVNDMPIDDLDTAVDGDEDSALEKEEAALDAELDRFRDAFGGITLTTRVLARALIARTLGRESTAMEPLRIPAEQYYVPAVSHAEAERATLDGITHALLPSNVPPELWPSRLEQKAAFEEAAELVRELGLEEFDVSCHLEPVGDGSYELRSFEVSPENAHVELLEFLFNRAEGVAEFEDPLLTMERDASAWEFSRWSVAAPPGRASPDVATFARHVREQEYSLADRPTVALGRSVIGDLAADEQFGELFPRQHRMAVALRASIVDVFECVAVDGNRVTLRSIRDGSTYVVYEHLEPVQYSTGWVGAGRLLPFDGALHLRSPGMLFARADDLDLVRAAANDMGALERVLPPALALEAFISAAMLGVNVPRATKPMRSRADARQLLSELQTMLADAQLELDATLDAFVAALAEQAGGGSADKGRSPTGTGKKPMHKSKRRR